ncbi:hypothetical protein NBRC116592_35860 [Colwellia sp. KU-HH00111]|uniref:hypothetical protein n=1 Tax=Colwellia sp. KU-HH00111 TaxID=3127652 RepID=UPI0031062FB0
MLRPRDAINFVNLCLAECNGEIELNEDIVLEAEEKFYSVRKTALAKEWGSIFFHIDEYLDSLEFLTTINFKIKELTVQEKDSVLNYLMDRPNIQPDNEEHNNRMLNFDELVKVWFTVGVIGIQKSETLVIYSSFEKPELDITDLTKKFVIHPLFFRH